MGKSAREDQRQADRAARAEEQRRGEARRKRLPYLIGGTIVAVGVIVGLVLMASSGGGGIGSASPLPSGTKVFTEASKHHVAGTVKYDRTPPAGGDHNVVWLNCGIYSQPVANENAVHSLEHGAVWITYRPDLSAAGVSQLQQFVQSHYSGNQLYLVLSPYPGLPAPVIASAWGAQIHLQGPGDPRLASFVAHYIGGAQGGEPGSPCTGGTGKPA